MSVLSEITKLFAGNNPKKLNCLPFYKVLKEEGLDHQKKFYITVLIDNNIFGKGTGKSKKRPNKMLLIKL